MDTGKEKCKILVSEIRNTRRQENISRFNTKDSYLRILEGKKVVKITSEE